MGNDQKSQYLFYYYSEGIGNKQFEEVTLDDLASIVANPRTQSTIDELKSRYENSNLSEKQVKQKLATLFPAYVVGGCVRFAKKGDGDRVKLRVPVVFIDIDKVLVKDGEPRRLTQQEASDLRDDIAERCPHWLLVYTSQSDCGVHALLKLWKVPANDEEIKFVHGEVARWFEEAFPGYLVDRGARSDPRIAYIGHDTKVFCRDPDEAEWFTYSYTKKVAKRDSNAPQEASEPRDTVASFAGSLSEQIVQRVKDGMMKISPSPERQTWFQQLTDLKGVLQHLPKDEHEEFFQKNVVAWDQLGSKHDRADLEKQWYDPTYEPQYSRLDRFLWPIGGLKVQVFVDTNQPEAVKLERALSSTGYKLQYNMFTNRREVTDLRSGEVTAFEGPEREVIRSRVEAACCVVVNKRRRPFRQGDAIVESASWAIAKENSFNPAQDWLATIADVKEAPPCPLSECFHIETDWMREIGADPKDVIRMAEECFWAHIRGAVGRILVPGCKHDGVFVIVGGQGIGKSTFVQDICPNPDWFVQGLDLSHPDVNTIRQVQGKLMAEVADVAFARADANKQKGFIVGQSDWLNKKNQQEIEVPRVCIFSFTTNDDEHLAKDVTGGRRFNIVRLLLAKMDRNTMRAYLSETLDDYYGYAKHQVLNLGMDGRIPDEFEDMRDSAFAQSQAEDYSTSDRIRIIVKQLVDDKSSLKRSEQRIYSHEFTEAFHEKWGGQVRIYSNAITPIFKELGYVRKAKDDDGRFWSVT